jgi:hypothetical protein
MTLLCLKREKEKSMTDPGMMTMTDSGMMMMLMERPKI